MTEEQSAGHMVNRAGLPADFPTHLHEGSFWESLGRAIATFGFLEEVLGKAIFAFTATRPYEEAEIKQAYAEWLRKLERALSDPLGGLIDAYGKSVREHGGARIDRFDDLVTDLRKAAEVRNILCHASWPEPNASGASVPFYVDRKKLMVDSAMDRQFIDQVRRHTAELACAVIETVTSMGWQFSGSAGPGKPVWAP